jgi:transcription-repair coupling factor (superfamily II helicase)
LGNLPLFDLNVLNDRADWQNINFCLLQAKGVVNFSENIYALLPAGTDDAKYETEEYDFAAPQLYFQRFDLLEEDIERLHRQGMEVNIITSHAQQLPRTLRTYTTDSIPGELPFTGIDKLEMGFSSGIYKTVVLTDRELYGTIFVSSKRRTLKSSEAQKLLSQLEGEIEIGDYVVHEDYGVGIYRGFTQEDNLDYLKIEYAEEDELYVPLDQINKLTKFIGEQGEEVKVTRLGKNDWQQLRKKVKKQVAIAAEELARLYAQVKLANPFKTELDDSQLYQQFVEAFPYEETTDQLKAERDVISDLNKNKPMNRLLIGDVGFGKTEVMMRAAFKIVEAGGQVLVLCPTTVLALQHQSTFRNRFAHFGIEVAMVSRHNSASVNKENIEKFNEGKINILIGTHRLFTSEIDSEKLALLMIDEEQRFGVKQKEKIRKLEHGLHVLYVTATPIPRTLSMALSAIKDISMITTPPPGRKPVETHVEKLKWNLVTKAILSEVERSGQVLFVHNRVGTIPSIRAKLETLLPNIKIAVAHGQMSPHSLDKTMTDFYEKKYDCLLATTIIENGVDIANANTLIVTDAQNLGLAQMYQLRGRVGRSQRQAHAYFFYSGRDLNAVSEIQASDEEEQEFKLKPAKYIERLETILNSQQLGSGFKIASRDLEIRGAGNLLGREQHGNISKIGYGLYMQMLAEEIEKLKSDKTDKINS